MSDPISIIIATAALSVSIGAAAVTYWQTRLVRQSIEAQTFITVSERAREIDISSTLDVIGSLQYDDYATYKKSVSHREQAQVRAVVDFFNDLSHMMRDKYINDLYPMRIYQPALYVCAKHLLPWWVDGIRAETYPLLYQNFTWLCEYAMWSESRKESTEYSEIPSKGYRSFLKSRDVAP